MSNLICYTVITGEYDLIDTTLARANPGWECWLLTDGPAPADLHGWHHRKLPQSFYSPRRQARRAKILAHEMWPGADVTVWMDGNARLLPGRKLNHLADELGRATSLMAFGHGRKGAFEEAAACNALGLGLGDLIALQVGRYRDEGLPARFGLWNTRVIVRSASALCETASGPRDMLEELEHLWWSELLSGSCRDQIALPYAVWKCGATVKSLRESEWITMEPHVGERVPG